ncbi:MAG: PQQ-binding-like beta-propeller repeat protein [Opitutaceae bacterium]|nr:PQQ-binding-like beta-propeller repeat protein [Opitutaceae bacterium]
MLLPNPSPAALAALFLASALTLSAGAQFRSTPDGRGVESARGPESLQLRWKHQTQGPVISSPVTAGALVFFGSHDNQLRAVEARTGRLQWSYTTGGDIASAPAVADGLVVALSRDGKCHAVDAASGTAIWTFETGGESRYTRPGVCYTQPFTETVPDPWDLFLSSPVISQGKVVFGSGDSHLYALDLKTGALLWKFKTGDVVHASPVAADGVVYCGSFDKTFYALDEKTGALIWSFKTGSDDARHLMEGILSAAVVAEGSVYFGARDAKFYCLDAKTGTPRWVYDAGGTWIVASPVYLEGRVYFCTSDSHVFIGLDATTGKEVSRGSFKGFGLSSPIIAGKTAYVGSFAGECYAFDLVTGKLTSVFSTPGQIARQDAIFDSNGAVRNEVFVGCDSLDDTIVAIRTKLFSVGTMISSPTVADGIVFIGSADGHLYALGEPAAESASPK